MTDIVEHWHHMAHVVYGKDRIEHSALLAVVITCNTTINAKYSKE